jgi:hypothetical protein
MRHRRLTWSECGVGWRGGAASVVGGGGAGNLDHESAKAREGTKHEGREARRFRGLRASRSSGLFAAS